ncbi:MAG: vWA domain-containing protein [Methylococcales bacterium]|nr:vWA domain-containing protein [Methylococcales bacterium]
MGLIAFDTPSWLWLTPLVLLPWLGRRPEAVRYSSFQALPFDALSWSIAAFLKLAEATVIAALILTLAGPYLKEQTRDRIGSGAQIVLLLDRSASMNDNFAGRYLGGSAKETKVAVARKVLSDFVGQRDDDFFGMVSFSTAPIFVLPLTQAKPAILSAINATHSRGHGVTNVAPALMMALSYFDDRPVTGARVIVLISDGGAHIEPSVQAKLKQAFRQQKVSLYWLYLRNVNAAGLDVKSANANETTTPEYFLHQFFQSLSTPYRAYQVEDPKALQQAVADIGQQQNQPIRYQQRLARQDLKSWCLAAALIALLLLLTARLLEAKAETALGQRW